MLDRHLCEFYKRTPLRCVIYILIKRKAMVQAVDETIVHDIVHTAVSSYPFSLLNEALLTGNRMLVYSHNRITLSGRHIVFRIQIL